MVKAELRKVVKLGGTFYVGLTNDIVKQFGIDKRSMVKMAALHGQIIIEPLESEIEVNNTQGRHKVKLTMQESN